MQLRSKAGALVVTGVLLALSGPLNATATEPARAPARAVAPGAAKAAAAAAAEGPDPIDFAVVVDQSKSLADKDLIREVEAAALLSQGEISERSRAAVIGFGSSEKAGQSPVREVCGLTVADAAGRQRLSDCVQQLSHRDPKHTGPGTDFPAAVRQAVDRLSEGTDTAVPKVVFLLTDGKLDVSDSPEYGTDAASRQANGAKRLTEELARARSESVQIWPLGFGSEIDKAALTAMAEGGYRNGCADLPGATPGCAWWTARRRSTRRSRRPSQRPAAPRSRKERSESPGQSDGDDPADRHRRLDHRQQARPQGVGHVLRSERPKGAHPGEFDGSSFETSGQDGPVEALRVKNPLPGRWRVHVEAPEGHRDREVAVRAIWQGRLRSAVTLDPASPRAGERAVVEVRMQTRRGVVVTDPSQLAGVKVSARLSGTGFAPVTVSLADDGREPDRQAQDVRFTGTLTVAVAPRAISNSPPRWPLPGSPPTTAPSTPASPRAPRRSPRD